MKFTMLSCTIKHCFREVCGLGVEMFEFQRGKNNVLLHILGQVATHTSVYIIVVIKQCDARKDLLMKKP